MFRSFAILLFSGILACFHSEAMAESASGECSENIEFVELQSPSGVRNEVAHSPRVATVITNFTDASSISLSQGQKLTKKVKSFIRFRRILI